MSATTEIRPTEISARVRRRRRIDRVLLRGGRILGLSLLHILVIAGAVFFTIPFAWMVSTSLKQGGLVMKMPPIWIPPKFIWSNYTEPWVLVPFGSFYKNTVIISALTVLGTLASGTIVAYAFARLRFPGRSFLFLTVLASMMLPGQVTLIPRFVFYSKLGWIDSWYPLVVPPFLGGAFSIFLMRQYFMTISPELDDAAKIDGCSLLGIFFRILLPLSRPVLGVVGISTLMGSWNNFFQPLIYINRVELMPIAIGLRMFMDRDEGHMEWTMAMTVISIIPMMAVFFIAQRHFIQGIVLTGIKG